MTRNDTDAHATGVGAGADIIVRQSASRSNSHSNGSSDGGRPLTPPFNVMSSQREHTSSAAVRHNNDGEDEDENEFHRSDEDVDEDEDAQEEEEEEVQSAAATAAVADIDLQMFSSPAQVRSSTNNIKGCANEDMGSPMFFMSPGDQRHAPLPDTPAEEQELHAQPVFDGAAATPMSPAQVLLPRALPFLSSPPPATTTVAAASAVTGATAEPAVAAIEAAEQTAAGVAPTGPSSLPALPMTSRVAATPTSSDSVAMQVQRDEEVLAVLAAKKRTLLSEIGALLTLRERLHADMAQARAEIQSNPGTMARAPFDYEVRFAHSPSTLKALREAAEAWRAELRQQQVAEAASKQATRSQMQASDMITPLRNRARAAGAVEPIPSIIASTTAAATSASRRGSNGNAQVPVHPIAEEAGDTESEAENNGLAGHSSSRAADGFSASGIYNGIEFEESMFFDGEEDDDAESTVVAEMPRQPQQQQQQQHPAQMMMRTPASRSQQRPSTAAAAPPSQWFHTSAAQPQYQQRPHTAQPNYAYPTPSSNHRSDRQSYYATSASSQTSSSSRPSSSYISRSSLAQRAPPPPLPHPQSQLSQPQQRLSLRPASLASSFEESSSSHARAPSPPRTKQQQPSKDSQPPPQQSQQSQSTPPSSSGPACYTTRKAAALKVYAQEAFESFGGLSLGSVAERGHHAQRERLLADPVHGNLHARVGHIGAGVLLSPSFRSSDKTGGSGSSAARRERDHQQHHADSQQHASGHHTSRTALGNLTNSSSNSLAGGMRSASKKSVERSSHSTPRSAEKNILRW